jgi:diaminopimelate epimerase
MYLHFYKYQGAGNDFIIIDGRHYAPLLMPEQIKFLCDRRFGIGADGLMILTLHNQYDFDMTYFNSDGSFGAMCGNGARCLVAFARKLNILDSYTKFMASDGEHEAYMIDYKTVKLKLKDVDKIRESDNYFFLNTGVPHYVEFVVNLKDKDIVEHGRKLRFDERFAPEGTNVNFVEFLSDKLFVRTYERGVENETLACGTGVTASALAAAIKFNPNTTNFDIETLGGNLKVFFKNDNKMFTDIWLQGPAEFVFEGNIELIVND